MFYLRRQMNNFILNRRKDRDGGVRIIEGSLLGNRGMDDLQEDLSNWQLYDNVSFCGTEYIKKNVFKYIQ